MPRKISSVIRRRGLRRGRHLDASGAGAGGDPSSCLVVLPGWEIARAATPWRRLRGLLGRREMAPREGLWLPVRSIHTLGMRMTIDLVWVAEGRVIRTDLSVRPGRMRTCWAADGVVEVAEGEGATLARALAAGSPS